MNYYGFHGYCDYVGYYIPNDRELFNFMCGLRDLVNQDTSTGENNKRVEKKVRKYINKCNLISYILREIDDSEYDEEDLLQQILPILDPVEGVTINDVKQAGISWYLLDDMDELIED